MRRDGTHRGLIWGLAATILLPVLLAVVLGLGALLSALGDTWGAVACQRAALAAGVLWIVAVVFTTVVNAITVLEFGGRRRRRRRRRPGRAAPPLHGGPPARFSDEPRDRPI